MAQKVQVQLIDDTDGSEATETVIFGLDGDRYEIDLSAGNALDLRGAVADYIEHARRANPARVTGRRPTRNLVDTAVVRLWLTDHGYKLKERGRIPVDLQEAYDNGTPHPDWHDKMQAAAPAVIADAKEEVKQKRTARASKPAAVAEPTAAAPAATKAKASATASPTAKAPTLKRPVQRAQRKEAAKDGAETETTIM